jgi:surface antigen
VGGAGDLGHVAIVKAVNTDGTYLEDGYNGNPPPNDHTYYTRTVKDSTPGAFLYLPAQKDLSLAS